MSVGLGVRVGWCLIGLQAFSVAQAAPSCQAQSAKTMTPLLELYTSEGCSSCPPADAWVRTLKAQPTPVNILAYHVDYWDSLGWKDPYAQASFSQKQRQQAAETANPVIYTPQFTLNGEDFRAWGDARLQQAQQSLQHTVAPVTLSLQLTEAPKQALTLGLHANALDVTEVAHVYVALYENGLSSVVRAGENQGRLLMHEKVVRALFGPYALSAHQALMQTFTLDKDWRLRDAGAVAYVQSVKHGQVLQSLNLDFCALP